MKPLPARAGALGPQYPRRARPIVPALVAGMLAAVSAALPFLRPVEPAAAMPAVSERGPAHTLPARLDLHPLSPAAEKLAAVVARRYRIAVASAREVVETAFREGRRNGLDPLLILAVIAVESRFNPIAESEQGAVGLMQVMPRLHADKLAEIGAVSALPPHANIALGARILREAIRRGGGEAAGLQLYNGAPDDETRAYANRVQAERKRLTDSLPRSRDRA